MSSGEWLKVENEQNDDEPPGSDQILCTLGWKPKETDISGLYF